MDGTCRYCDIFESIPDTNQHRKIAESQCNRRQNQPFSSNFSSQPLYQGSQCVPLDSPRQRCKNNRHSFFECISRDLQHMKSRFHMQSNSTGLYLDVIEWMKGEIGLNTMQEWVYRNTIEIHIVNVIHTLGDRHEEPKCFECRLFQLPTYIQRWVEFEYLCYGKLPLKRYQFWWGPYWCKSSACK